VEALAALAPPLFTCWPVITEAAWLLRKDHRPLDRIADAHKAAMLELIPHTAESLTHVASIMRRYEESGVHLADAALLHLADRESISTVLTLDRRDFSIMRLRRNRSLKLIPDLP
jgi:predicted nucleic acid-binding protein